MGIFKNILIGEKTDQGLKRENNEDSYVIVDQSLQGHDVHHFGLLFAVADGMGGHVAGETASRMACEKLVAMYYTDESKATETTGDSGITGRHLEQVIHRVNEEIVQYSEENDGLEGMGTTLSVLILLEGEALIGHVGDSRIYRLRGETFRQLTVDHTEVQALVEMGRLKPERAANHPRRHILTQAVGVEDELEEVFTQLEKLEEGDVFLLCSDGLHDMVANEEIREILLANPAPQGACDALVGRALENGGEDNVTVIVVRI